MTERQVYSQEVAEGAKFSEVTVERTLSDKQRAETHVVGRNRRVGQFLCYLSLMRSHGLITQRTVCRGAQFQDFQSEGGHEAAHYLPGQIYLHTAGRVESLPWELVSDRSTRDAIAALFSRPQDLPANFNKADSYAEKYAKPSLKAVFADVCQLVLNAPTISAGRVAVAEVRSAYGQWIGQSVQAYRSAINRKIDIAELDDLPPATAPGFADGGVWDPNLLNPNFADLTERAVRKNRDGRASATVWDYSEQTRILGHYLQFTQGSTLSDKIILDVQTTFRP